MVKHIHIILNGNHTSTVDYVGVKDVLLVTHLAQWLDRVDMIWDTDIMQLTHLFLALVLALNSDIEFTKHAHVNACLRWMQHP